MKHCECIRADLAERKSAARKGLHIWCSLQLPFFFCSPFLSLLQFGSCRISTFFFSVFGNVYLMAAMYMCAFERSAHRCSAIGRMCRNDQWETVYAYYCYHIFLPTGALCNFFMVFLSDQQQHRQPNFGFCCSLFDNFFLVQLLQCFNIAECYYLLVGCVTFLFRCDDDQRPVDQATSNEGNDGK